MALLNDFKGEIHYLTLLSMIPPNLHALPPKGNAGHLSYVELVTQESLSLWNCIVNWILPIIAGAKNFIMNSGAIKKRNFQCSASSAMIQRMTEMVHRGFTDTAICRKTFNRCTRRLSVEWFSPRILKSDRIKSSSSNKSKTSCIQKNGSW